MQELYDEAHKEELEQQAARVSKVIGVARQLYEMLNASPLTADDRLAARQLFNVLYDRLGPK